MVGLISPCFIHQVGRALQPSVFFVGDCEKMFKKKIPKTDPVSSLQSDSCVNLQSCLWTALCMSIFNFHNVSLRMRCLGAPLCGRILWASQQEERGTFSQTLKADARLGLWTECNCYIRLLFAVNQPIPDSFLMILVTERTKDGLSVLIFIFNDISSSGVIGLFDVLRFTCGHEQVG